MFSWLLRSSFKLLLLASFGAFAVMVPIGRRTLLGHASAIAATRPAQQLCEDLMDAGRHLRNEARQVLGEVTGGAVESIGTVATGNSEEAAASEEAGR